jgi:hypothetical protein
MRGLHEVRSPEIWLVWELLNVQGYLTMFERPKWSNVDVRLQGDPPGLSNVDSPAGQFSKDRTPGNIRLPVFLQTIEAREHHR